MPPKDRSSREFWKTLARTAKTETIHPVRIDTTGRVPKSDTASLPKFPKTNRPNLDGSNPAATSNQAASSSARGTTNSTDDTGKIVADEHETRSEITTYSNMSVQKSPSSIDVDEHGHRLLPISLDDPKAKGIVASSSASSVIANPSINGDVAHEAEIDTGTKGRPTRKSAHRQGTTATVSFEDTGEYVAAKKTRSAETKHDIPSYPYYRGSNWAFDPSLQKISSAESLTNLEVGQMPFHKAPASHFSLKRSLKVSPEVPMVANPLKETDDTQKWFDKISRQVGMGRPSQQLSMALSDKRLPDVRSRNLQALIKHSAAFRAFMGIGHGKSDVGPGLGKYFIAPLALAHTAVLKINTTLAQNALQRIAAIEPALHDDRNSSYLEVAYEEGVKHLAAHLPDMNAVLQAELACLPINKRLAKQALDLFEDKMATLHDDTPDAQIRSVLHDMSAIKKAVHVERWTPQFENAFNHGVSYLRERLPDMDSVMQAELASLGIDETLSSKALGLLEGKVVAFNDGTLDARMQNDLGLGIGYLLAHVHLMTECRAKASELVTGYVGTVSSQSESNSGSRSNSSSAL